MSKWGWGETIGLIGLLVTITAFATPEVRCIVGLQSESCPSKDSEAKKQSKEEETKNRSFLEEIAGEYSLISWTEAHRPISLGFEVKEGSLSIDNAGDAKWSVLLQQEYATNPGQVRMVARGRVLIGERKLEGVTGGQDNNTHYLDERWGQVSSDVELAVRGWNPGANPDSFTISTNTSSNGITLLQMTNSRGTFTWRR